MADAKKTKKRRKWPFVLLVLVLLAGAAVLAAPEVVYHAAQDKFAAGDYDMAQQMFAQLQEYKDSAAYLEQIGQIRTYEKACSLLEAGAFEEAGAQFASLGNYRDSKAMVTECKYQNAVSQLKYGASTDHEAVAEAREIFLSLDGYKESNQYLQQFTIANTYLARAYIQSGEDLGQEPLYYDAQGRLTGKGSEPEQYAYDEEGRLIYDAPDHIAYEEEGRVYQRSNEDRIITYGYDKKGNECERTYYYLDSKRSRSRPVRYERKYSKNLLVKESFYDDGKLWSVNEYTYDDQGRILEHTLQNYGGKPNSTDYVYRYSYNEDGTLRQKEYIYQDPAGSYVETCVYGYIWTPENT